MSGPVQGSLQVIEGGFSGWQADHVQCSGRDDGHDLLQAVSDGDRSTTTASTFITAASRLPHVALAGLSVGGPCGSEI